MPLFMPALVASQSTTVVVAHVKRQPRAIGDPKPPEPAFVANIFVPMACDELGRTPRLRPHHMVKEVSLATGVQIEPQRIYFVESIQELGLYRLKLVQHGKVEHYRLWVVPKE